MRIAVLEGISLIQRDYFIYFFLATIFKIYAGIPKDIKTYMLVDNIILCIYDTVY